MSRWQIRRRLQPLQTGYPASSMVLHPPPTSPRLFPSLPGAHPNSHYLIYHYIYTLYIYTYIYTLCTYTYITIGSGLVISCELCSDNVRATETVCTRPACDPLPVHPLRSVLLPILASLRPTSAAEMGAILPHPTHYPALRPAHPGF